MCDTAGDVAENLLWTLGEEVVSVVLDVPALVELGVVTAGLVTGVDTGRLDKVKTTAPGNIPAMFKGMFA